MVFDQILEVRFSINIYIVSTFPSFIRLGCRNPLFSRLSGYKKTHIYSEKTHIYSQKNTYLQSHLFQKTHIYSEFPPRKNTFLQLKNTYICLQTCFLMI